MILAQSLGNNFKIAHFLGLKKCNVGAVQFDNFKATFWVAFFIIKDQEELQIRI